MVLRISLDSSTGRALSPLPLEVPGNPRFYAYRSCRAIFICRYCLGPRTDIAGGLFTSAVVAVSQSLVMMNVARLLWNSFSHGNNLFHDRLDLW